jgi:hypothetical protein
MPEGELLKPDNIDKIRHIPTVIVQGRYVAFFFLFHFFSFAARWFRGQSADGPKRAATIAYVPSRPLGTFTALSRRPSSCVAVFPFFPRTLPVVYRSR